jgi:hypothetical protein
VTKKKKKTTTKKNRIRLNILLILMCAQSHPGTFTKGEGNHDLEDAVIRATSESQGIRKERTILERNPGR